MSIPNVIQQPVNVSAIVNQPPAQRVSNTSITPAPESIPPAVNTPTKTVKQLEADNQNLSNVVDQLRQIATQNERTPLTPLQISSALKSQIDAPCVGSTYALTRSSPPTLEAVITDLGFEQPSTVDQLTALAKTIEQRALTPPLGNLGGARSWPIPMSREDQDKINSFLYATNTGVPGLPLTKNGNGVLHYLLHGSSVSHSDLQSPLGALQKLLDSPKAQVLGQALQTHLNGVPSATSIYDYLLTAINIGLDPDSIWSAERNKISGFALNHFSRWGESPTSLVDPLGNWLITRGRVSHARHKLAVLLLLGKSAPQFLIKDIPQSVKFGSILWTQLTIAAAKIEAQTPGRVPNMTYSEVIAAAESMPNSAVDVQVAEREALRDWGVTNGLLKSSDPKWVVVDERLVPEDIEPSAPDIERVRVAYNRQLQALANTSNSLYTPIPNRKEMALSCLKAEFPGVNVAVFKAKSLAKLCTQTGLGGRGDPRARSMLDITMEGEKLEPHFKWITNDSRIPINAFNTFARSEKISRPNAEFDSAYDPAIKAQKAGHHGMVKYLISTLPLKDRVNLEYGKLDFFYSNDYKKTANNQNELVKRGHTLYVKTSLKGLGNKMEYSLYEIDATAGTITKKNDRLATLYNPLNLPKTNEQSEQVFSLIKLYHPFDGDRASYYDERSVSAAIPNSYSTSRTNNIAMFYVDTLKLDDEATRNYAEGVTSFDHDRAGDVAVGEFLLNLIPGRSAIVNIARGNYGGAVTDLALDIFGLLTLGAGKAAQATKALGQGLNASSKLAKTVKFIGISAVEAFNPLSASVSLLEGGGKLLKYSFAKGAETVNKLRGASGSYDVLKAASKNHDVVATGTYKIAGSTYEAGAVMSEGKWYLYNPVTGRGYGKSLPVFNAQSVAMGGVMQEFKVLGTGLGMSADQTKRGLRLTLDAHGNIPNGQRSAVMSANGTELTPSELLDILKAQGIKLDKYAEIRLTMCYSGSGGAHSFAAQFAKLTKKPVEGFEGKMHIDSDTVDDVVTRVFANKAKMRDFIDENIINKSKHSPIKYDVTGKTPDGRNILEHSPDYNPVRFDSNGIQLPAKPRRAPITEAAARPDVELPSGKTSQPTIDFDDYDDLT
ncbi:hypothetical protein ACSHWC_25720 [Pseudomonas fluorescens]